MANNLAQRLSGLGGKISTALFGTQPTIVQQGGQYPTELQEYLDDFENQQYVKDLMNKPAQERYSLDQLKEGFTQGLNFGSKDIADEQKRLNINIPKTGEEIDLAQQGLFNSYPMQSTLVAQPNKGGFFNDFASGYNENYNNGFSFSNLQPQKKGFATRLGEGLGSVGRFIDSPVGRGLIAAGLNSALGYDNSLQEGLTAAVGRQNAQTQDSLYRKSLIDDYGFDPEEIGNIRGNITKDLYNTIASNRYKQQSMQLRRELSEAKDNVSRARIILTGLNNGTIEPKEAQIQIAKYGITINDLKESNQTRNTDMNEQLLPYKQYALQTAPQVALGNLGVAQGNLGLRQAEFNYKQYQDALEKANPKIDPKTKLALRDKTDALAQIQELRNLVNNNPGATGLVVGSLAKGKELSQKIANANSTNGQIQTRAGIAKLRGTTMHDLAGTAQTLQEQRNLAPFLPDATDDIRTINAKLDQLEAELKREYNSINNAYGGNFGVVQQMPAQDADPLGIL